MKIDDEGLWDRHPHALVSCHGIGEEDGELYQVGSAVTFIQFQFSVFNILLINETYIKMWSKIE